MSGSRKRARPGVASSSSLPKRARRAPAGAAGRLPEAAEDELSRAAGRSSSPSLVMVTGLPADCTVLELKSRLEMYGPISRTRIVDGSGYVTFRSDGAAEAAIAAALDPAFGITIQSKRVLVIRASDPLPNAGTGASTHSKLLQAEIPLSRHGRSNKKPSAGTASTRSGSDPYQGREIVAYDDLL